MSRDVTERAFRYSMTRTRLLAGYDMYLRMMPMLDAGRAARRRRLPDEHRPPQPSAPSCSRSRSATGLNQFASAFGEIASAWQYLRSAQDRVAEMLALELAPGHRRPDDPAALERARAARRRGHLRRAPASCTASTSRCGRASSWWCTGPRVAASRRSPASPSGSSCRRRRGTALDGIELADLDPTQLRQTIRVVSEEPLLLAASLRDNLLLGAWGEISDDAMLDAMRAAGARGGRRGARRARRRGRRPRPHGLGWAAPTHLVGTRALVAHPRVLMLDDALSAVNPSLEIEIMRRVRGVPPRDGDPVHHPANGPRRRSPTAHCASNRRSTSAADRGGRTGRTARRIDRTAGRGRGGGVGPSTVTRSTRSTPSISSGMESEVAQGTAGVSSRAVQGLAAYRPGDRCAARQAAGHRRRAARPRRADRRRGAASCLERSRWRSRAPWPSAFGLGAARRRSAASRPTSCSGGSPTPSATTTARTPRPRTSGRGIARHHRSRRRLRLPSTHASCAALHPERDRRCSDGVSSTGSRSWA